MRWAVGLTTVPSRMNGLARQSLNSIRAAGFVVDRVFIDGLQDVEDFDNTTGVAVTNRWPQIRTMGNWCLGLGELYLRNPAAERYAMFQDDLLCVGNLRAYLESCEYPEKGYLNLYTFPINVKIGSGQKGWYPSNQRGLGAVGLVFSNEAVRLLLGAAHMINRVHDPRKGWRSIDGGIVTAFRAAGWKEYVHNPSLLQHVGYESTMGNRRHPQADSFPGESFDALRLLCPT